MNNASHAKQHGRFTQGFHVTTAAALPSILSTGLEPRIGPRSVELGEDRPAVYFFETLSDVEQGLMNWMTDVFDEAEDIVVLEVDITDVSCSQADGQFEIVASERISPDKIIRQYDERLRLLAVGQTSVSRPPPPSNL